MNTYKNRVSEFVKDYNTEDLCFYSYSFKTHTYEVQEFKDLKITVSNTLAKIIVNTLEHTSKYESGTKDSKLMETNAGRYRSALDIWRHIKKYNPKLTLNEVMKCIADNWEDMGLYSHFCCTVDRRVFRVADNDNWMVEILDEDETDEFGLEFSDWRNV